MKLQTKISLKQESKNAISYNSNIILLGSCFSDHIGKKLNYFKYQTLQNPFGILFHPKAIETLITNAVNKKKYLKTDLIYHNESFHNFNAHSSISAITDTEILQNLNSAIALTEKKIKKASHIIITLGTSWVYRDIKSDKIVANCHKVPQKLFSKEILSIDEITASLENILHLIHTVNKNAVVLFTVSPIRHLKDGFIENTRSKSHLITAIHNITNNKENAFYFPSYEIMMDELRDYRFYAEDMIHPNTTAINYIWERFVDTWFSENSKQLMTEIDAVQKGISHKPFNEKSEKHQLFLKNLKLKILKLKEKIPDISFK